MKIWIRFGKNERLRYVSHLDLQRFMQRALNRTELPIAWSQGFSPHPLMSFGSAMAMGWTSEYEVLEIRMAKEIDALETARQMARALPPDLPVLSARVLDDTKPAPMALVQAADYAITLQGEAAGVICAQIPHYLARQHVPAIRKTKSGEKEVDIRPMTHILRCAPEADNVFYARLSLTEQATCKPDLIVKALSQMAGVEEECPLRVHRLTLLGGERDTFRPMMEL